MFKLNHLVPILVFIGMMGCVDVPATNPFDPEAPVELQRKVSLEGRVQDLENEAPITGAIVTLYGPTSPSNNPVTTDEGVEGEEAGIFRFIDLDPGPYRVEVTHPGYLSQAVEVGQVDGGQAVERVIKMIKIPTTLEGVDGVPSSSARITGLALKAGENLLDEARQDHSNITVEVIGTGLRTVTGPKGEYDLFLNPGTYDLRFSAPNHVAEEQFDIEVEEGEEGEEGESVITRPTITLSSDPGRLTGQISLELSEDALEGIIVGLDPTGKQGTTDNDGLFEISDIIAGFHTLKVIHEGYDTYIFPGVQIRSSSETDLGELSLVRSRGGINGSVLLSGDTVHSGVSAQLIGTPFNALSTSDGRFSIERVPTGSYTLELCKMGYESHQTPLEVNTDTPDRLTAVEAVTLSKQQFSLVSDQRALVTREAQYLFEFERVPAWVTEVKVSGDLTAPEAEIYHPFDASEKTLDVTLTEGDGLKIINIQFKGDGCLISEPLQLFISLDQTAPAVISITPEDVIAVEGGLAVEGGYVTSNEEVSLSIRTASASHLLIGGEGVEAVNGQPALIDTPLETAEPEPLVVTLTLEAQEDGAREVQVVAVDQAGNTSAPMTLSLTLDRLAPTRPQVEVISPTPVTDPNAQVTLSLSAEDAVMMQIDNSSNFPNSEWLPYESNRSIIWTLRQPSIDGSKTVYARFRDLVGNVSEITSTSVIVDRIGSISAQVELIGGDGVLTQVQVIVDGVPGGTVDESGRLTVTDLDLGDHEIYVELAEYLQSDPITFEVGPESASPIDHLFALRSETGWIEGSVRLIGSEDVTRVRVMIDGEHRGEPDASGAFRFSASTFDPQTTENRFPREHEVRVDLGEYTPVQLVPVRYRVDANSTLPETHEFVLSYDYSGEVVANLEFVGTDFCGGVEIFLDGEATNFERLGCQVTLMNEEGERRLSVGGYSVRFERDGFEQESRVISLSPDQSHTIDEVLLRRSKGGVSGVVKLQGLTDHTGIDLDFTPRSSGPNYTAKTSEDGHFERQDMWVGDYDVSAQKDGFARSRFGVITIERGQTYELSTENSPLTLNRQVGDFLLNEGASYTQFEEISLKLNFDEIVAFRARIQGGEFPAQVCQGDEECAPAEQCIEEACWIRWADPNGDGNMSLGNLDVLGPEGTNPSDFEIEVDHPITLPAADQAYVIEVQVRTLDQVNSVEPFYQGGIILDRTPPAFPVSEGAPQPCADDTVCNSTDQCIAFVCAPAALLINEGDPYTNSSLGLVNLSLTAIDRFALTHVTLSNGSTCDHSSAITLPFSPTLSHQLANPEVDGEKRVTACFIDAAGNQSEARSSTITLDTTPPQLTTVQVVDALGELCAPLVETCVLNDRLIELRILESVFGETAEVSTSVEDPEFTSSAWQTPSTNLTDRSLFITLPNSDGPHQVYLSARDVAGNIVGRSVNDRLVLQMNLDTTAPPAPLLSTDPYTQLNQVTIEIANSTEAEAIELSWSPDFDDVELFVPSPQISVSLPDPSDGVYRAYVRLIDEADNQGVSRSIEVIRDTTAPILVTSNLNGGIETLSSPLTLPIAVDCIDAQTNATDLTMSIKVSNQATLYSGAYRSLVTVDLPNLEGSDTLEVTCADPAGNITPVSTLSYTLDTTPPPLGLNSLTINDDDQYTTSRNVSLTIIGQDDVGGVGLSEMAIINGNINCAQTLYQTYTEGLAWTLPDVQGETTVSVCVKDLAGNTTSLSDSIIIDTIAPPTPQVSASRYIQLDEVEVSIANFNDADTIAFSWSPSFDQSQLVAPTQSINILLPSATDGTYTLYVRFLDDAENAGASQSVEVTRDTVEPTLATALLNGGDTYVASAQNVQLTVSCVDAQANATELTLSVNSSSGNSIYQGSYQSAVSLDLPAQDGAESLEVRCGDPAGNESDPLSVAYTLDTTPPPLLTNSLNINEGAAHTLSRNVVLAITNNDSETEVTEMAIINGNIICATALYQTYTSGVQWTLPDVQGETTVSVCIKDLAGNTTSLSDSIIIDSIGPTGALSLDGVPANTRYSLTSNTPFMLTRDSIDATSYVLVEGAGAVCDLLTYLSFDETNSDADSDSNTMVASLTLDDGDQSVSLCLRDDAGNMTKYVLSFEVDTQDPSGFFRINQGATYTTNQSVVLNINKSDAVTEMKVRNNNNSINCDPANGGYIPLNLSYTHALSNQDGERTVQLCLKKSSGRWTSIDPVSITLDRVAPTSLALSNGAEGIRVVDNNGYTNQTSLPLRLGVTDATSGVDQYKVSMGGACVGGAWVDWVDGDQNGKIDSVGSVEPDDSVNQSISVRFKDAAGNESDCYTDSVIVDTVPPALTTFSIKGGGVSDAVGYTSSTTVTISSIGYSGDGGCVRYEISERNDFPLAETTSFAGCPGVGFQVDLTNISSDGPKTMYARAVDSAGNYSGSLSTTIILDRGDPTLSGVEILRGLGSHSSGDKYSNSKDVIVSLDGVSGATRIKYCALENGAQNCTTDPALLPEEVAYTTSFAVRFVNEGLKKVCVAALDDVGNDSGAPICDTITIDITPPPPPTLPKASLTDVNASCAYIEAERSDLTDFLRFEYRPLGGSWAPLDGASEDPNAPFDPSNNQSVATIKFPLTQDSDNLLQIRVVDQAGNVSDSSDALVEEVSSFLIPTDLNLKQVCNGGQYGILKEKLTKPASYRRSTCIESSIVVGDTPEVAIIDFERIDIRILSPSLTLGDVSTQECVASNFDNSIIDASCSPDPGQPMLLIAKPRANASNSCLIGVGDCETILDRFPPIGSLAVVEFVVMPDPIDEAQLPISYLGDLTHLSNGSGTPYAVHSIDVVDWRGDYEAGVYSFRAFGTDVEHVYTLTDFFDLSTGSRIIGKEYYTHIRRFEYFGGSSSPLIRTAYTSVEGIDNFNLFALSTYGSAVNYLKYDQTQWEIYSTSSYGSAGSAISNFTQSETDVDRSPFRTRAHPSHYIHVTGSAGASEARGSSIYLNDNNSALVKTKRADQNSVGGSSASGGVAGASFFEVGYRDAWWVDIGDSRTIYRSTVYGQNPTRLRYSIDTTLPIFPTPQGSLSLGEPYVVYHTTGVTRGVVIAYLDENDESIDECAR